jgi:Macrocin-O-methyltransferase (TylF)
MERRQHPNWSKLLKNRASRLHGFDSFEGLPEDWDPHGGSILGKGHFSTQGNIPQVPDDRVKFFKGWFEQTLPRYEFVDSPVIVLFMDADLYSLTSYVLKTLRPHIKVGSIIYFDEFWDRHHELKAFDEFLKETDTRFELLAATYGMRNVAFRRIG